MNHDNVRLELFERSFQAALDAAGDVHALDLHNHEQGACTCNFHYPCTSCGQNVSTIGTELVRAQQVQGRCGQCVAAGETRKTERLAEELAQLRQTRDNALSAYVHDATPDNWSVWRLAQRDVMLACGEEVLVYYRYCQLCGNAVDEDTVEAPCAECGGLEWGPVAPPEPPEHEPRFFGDVLYDPDYDFLEEHEHGC